MKNRLPKNVCSLTSMCLFTVAVLIWIVGLGHSPVSNVVKVGGVAQIDVVASPTSPPLQHVVSRGIANSGMETTVDFERHVAPLLGRLGCNSAACHGAFGGKGGMQFSLFGYSSKMDFENLKGRFDTEEPEESLLLQKPCGQEDHKGGVLFEEQSKTYQLIRDWIAQGGNWIPGSGIVERLVVSPGEIVFAELAKGQSKQKRNRFQLDSRELSVVAVFKDGSRENVTQFCKFSSRDEGIVEVSAGGAATPVKPGDTSIVISYRNAYYAVPTLVPYPALNKEWDKAKTRLSDSSKIDQRILEKLKKLNIEPSVQSGDEEFLRRVTLDTIGALPTADEIQAFVEDNRVEKREIKIDELLRHPRHAALWATRMCDITKCDVDRMDDDDSLNRRRAQMWHDWFRVRFSENKPYSEIVRGVITATSQEELNNKTWIRSEERLIRGNQSAIEEGYSRRATLDLYWRRKNVDGIYPMKELSELTAAAFTGVRLNCAQCHKHPFDRWTQNDYAAFANIFSRVKYGTASETNVAIFAELERRRQLKVNGEKVDPLPRIREVFTSELLRREIAGSERDARVNPRAFESGEFDNDKDLRQQFFEWLIRDDNPYFARNFVNRVWAAYFGKGLVEPVDDFSISNPPSHPLLLDDLAASFRASGFDIRQLEKRILMSATYQRTSTPNGKNKFDLRNYSRQTVRPLMAEVVLDCLNQALGTKENFGRAGRKGATAIEIGTNKLSGDAGRALKFFGRGNRKTICDCDRQTGGDLRQYIFLVNDDVIHTKIDQGTVKQLLLLDDDGIAIELYLRFFARSPTDDEVQIVKKHLVDSKNRETALLDLVWAMVNAREFLTNH